MLKDTKKGGYLAPFWYIELFHDRDVDLDRELWAIIEKYDGYEAMIADRVSPENFNSLLERSQAEQKALKNRMELNRARLDGQEREREDNSRWIMLIREYADIQELDAEMLNQLIRKIVIYDNSRTIPCTIAVII